VFVVVLAGMGTVAYIVSFYVQGDTTTRDCAVVFGAAVWPGGEASPALRDRTYAGIDAYERGQVNCLVFSGSDSAYNKHEVDVMLDIAYKRGVAPDDIELDYKGSNTKQTILNLDTSRSYLLVSNDFHLARISLLATQREGLDFEVMGSDYLQRRYTREPFFILREAAAFWYYVLGG
tara:strand:- start:8442 stop:8972 length:531 start_codon:yes stop_codon:yes gene_type:complete